MQTVWKYTFLRGGGFVHLDLPVGAQFCKLDFQETDLVAWFIVDSEAKQEIRQFMVARTGEDLKTEYYGLKYLDTAQIQSLNSSFPNYVVHLFEVFTP